MGRVGAGALTSSFSLYSLPISARISACPSANSYPSGKQQDGGLLLQVGLVQTSVLPQVQRMVLVSDPHHPNRLTVLGHSSLRLSHKRLILLQMFSPHDITPQT